MLRSKINHLLILILPVIVVGIAGCPFSPDKGKGKPPDPPTEYLPQTTIPNVLANLIRSYEEKNYEQYIKLLEPGFAYIFNPEDAGHNGIPAEWGLADEKISAENMFGSEPNKDGFRAGKIELDFTAGAPEEDPPLNPEWTRVLLNPVNLRVHTTHKDTGDILVYEVLNNQAELYFVKNDQTWYIVRWEDKPVGALVAAN